MTIFKVFTAFALILCAEATAQTSFWTNSSVPTLREDSDNKSVTVGLTFYSDVPGSITGVRFYKGSGNTGTHIGTLWSSTGTKLASVTFSGETSYGWQLAAFSPSVNITANTTYVISYSAPNGHYSGDQYYPWSTLSAGPLHVAGRSPGVYAYGWGAVFPTSAWNGSNYWVDVVFKPASAPPTSGTYSISGTVSGSGVTQLTLSGPISGSTSTNTSGAYTFSGLPNGLYVVALSKSGFTFKPPTASVTINGQSVTGLTFIGTAVANPVPHTVSLSWKASTSSGIRGYNVYRADVAGGTYAKLTSSPVSATTYIDSAVASGRIYYYVTTAIDTNNVESAYSNQATAAVPSP